METNIAIISILGFGISYAILDMLGIIDKTRCFFFGHIWEKIHEDENSKYTTCVCSRCNIIEYEE
jgi:hypothetical protein